MFIKCRNLGIFYLGYITCLIAYLENYIGFFHHKACLNEDWNYHGT